MKRRLIQVNPSDVHIIDIEQEIQHNDVYDGYYAFPLCGMEDILLPASANFLTNRYLLPTCLECVEEAKKLRNAAAKKLPPEEMNEEDLFLWQNEYWTIHEPIHFLGAVVKFKGDFSGLGIEHE